MKHPADGGLGKPSMGHGLFAAGKVKARILPESGSFSEKGGSYLLR
jgi:hypothetical protein